MQSHVKNSHFRRAIAISLLGLCSGCHKHAPAASGAFDVSQSVCSLPALHADYDGQRVTVRGLFALHAHGVFLRDEKCPSYMLALKRAANGTDITLCSPESLAQVFGCPGGNDNGPLVTVSGILKPSKTPES